MDEIRVHIRWIVRRDMPSVLRIERFNREKWTEKEFVENLKESNCYGIVAEYQEKVVGFVVYTLEKEFIHTLNFGVHPSYRSKGVGSQLLARLLSLIGKKRKTVDFIVHERNVGLQLFLKENGFKAIEIIHDYFDKDDAYMFQYILRNDSEFLYKRRKTVG